MRRFRAKNVSCARKDDGADSEVKHTNKASHILVLHLCLTQVCVPLFQSVAQHSY